MGRVVTIRLEDTDIQEIDQQMKKEGLENRSILLRKCWSIYRQLKKHEEEGRILILMPKDQAQTYPIQIIL